VTVLWQGSFLHKLKKISCPIGSKTMETGIILSIVDIEKELLFVLKKAYWLNSNYQPAVQTCVKGYWTDQKTDFPKS
jgi:hypothetical protein